MLCALALISRPTGPGKTLLAFSAKGKFASVEKAVEVKVEKIKFDNALAKLLRAKPQPRKKIKTQGKRGPRTPILSK